MPETIPDYFFRAAARHKNKIALRYKQDGAFSGAFNWAEWSEKVCATALALKKLGIRKGDRVGILAENSPFWTLADLGALTLGAVVVPIYPTLSADDIAFIIQDSGLKVLFVSTEEQLAKVQSLKHRDAFQIISFFESSQNLVLSLKKVLADFSQQDTEQLLQTYAENAEPDDLATLIYTSGTTGMPKGVMLTHRNFIENYLGSSLRIKITEEDVALSFLPLSHVFERMAGYYFMTFSGAEIVYAESMQTVAEDIRQVRPTVAAAVPRFYEKVYAAIQAKLQKGGFAAQWLFKQAFLTRKKVKERRSKGIEPSFWLRKSDAFFDRVVFSKIRMGVGGRMRFFISGGAPLSKELAEFFDLAGVLILEGYGLTETSPVIAVNTETELRFGTVGKPLSNVRVKIAEDGEILTSGPCVMKGYWNNESATAEVLIDGWFHTGDIGEIDADGYLKITDRKKDLIVTAGGKKVAPQKLEALIIRDPLFSQAITLGDKKPYIIALVVLNRAVAEEGAQNLKLAAGDFEAWLKDARFQQWVESRLQAQLENVARFESVKKVAILKDEFSIAKGELTPTLKVKRRFVMDKYSATIDALYRGDAS